MIRLWLLSIICLSPALWAQTTGDEQQRYRDNLQKWRAASIHSYSLTLKESECFCLNGLYYGPVKNYIKNDLIKKSVYLGEPRDGLHRGSLIKRSTAVRATVDDLFSSVDLRLKNPDFLLYGKVEYHPIYGFPALISFDHPDWEDEQFKLTVIGFSPNNEKQ